MTKDQKEYFKSLEADFLTIRPIFAGMPSWEAYHGLCKTYAKLLSRLSQKDTIELLARFENNLYDYKNKKT
jgi:hypothetical protein